MATQAQPVAEPLGLVPVTVLVDRGVNEIGWGEFASQPGFQAADAQHSLDAVCAPQIRLHHVVLVKFAGILAAPEAAPIPCELQRFERQGGQLAGRIELLAAFVMAPR